MPICCCDVPSSCVLAVNGTADTTVETDVRRQPVLADTVVLVLQRQSHNDHTWKGTRLPGCRLREYLLLQRHWHR